MRSHGIGGNSRSDGVGLCEVECVLGERPSRTTAWRRARHCELGGCPEDFAGRAKSTRSARIGDGPPVISISRAARTCCDVEICIFRRLPVASSMQVTVVVRLPSTLDMSGPALHCRGRLSSALSSCGQGRGRDRPEQHFELGRAGRIRVWVSGHLQPGMAEASAMFRRLPKLKKKVADLLEQFGKSGERGSHPEVRSYEP